MFVEGEVEIKIKDRVATTLDDHELKLWIQRSFKDMSCYRISSFARQTGSAVVRAVVAIKTEVLAEADKKAIESRPNDTVALRTFIEKQFEGKGSCRAVGDPKLRPN